MRRLLVSVVRAVDARPSGPGVLRRAAVRRPREELEVDEALAVHAQGGADAVRARVAAADDHDVLPLGVHLLARPVALELALPVCEECVLVLAKELHGEMDSGELSARDLEVVGHGGAHGEEHGVVFLAQVLGLDVHAHLHPALEGDALRLEDVEAPLHAILLKLHVGDAVHEQAAGLLVALVDRHRVALAVEHVRRRETRRARAHHRHLLARPRLRGLRHDPALAEGLVDDGVLHILDGHGGVDEPGDAGTLAGGGTDPPRELGEVVGGPQVVVGVAPAAIIDELVELGNEVVNGAARIGLAEGRAAVHAPRRLACQFLALRRRARVLQVDLPPVLQPLGRGPVRLGVALIVQETARL
mmetsp:Transcript_10091/g.29727  ORF Transcript_10091/g.29727 Transcript_10091/m.29727 type:complete len:359 (+) Transcript_10091:697-1773(+)